MPTLTDLTGKAHLSYSSLDSYLTCGERYRLERIMSVPQSPAWWFIGGSAFHRATELIDTDEIDSPNVAWEVAWTAQYKQELADVDDESTVRAGGRASKQYPNRENREWWEDNGPILVNQYMQWKTDSGYQPLHVELEFDTTIYDVPVRGFIDRVYVNPDGEMVVVDLKTGQREPASQLQLATYRVALLKQYDMHVDYGSYYMARKGTLGVTWALHKYNEDMIGKWYHDAKRGIESEIFIPHVTSMCQTCSVAPYCVAVGGTAPRTQHGSGNN